ncbi:MAG: hypothetical protein J3Q66DRAFT_390863 [Benniella sp.]|nr:MAG: hypothetical protein J3Q66DRAFT_390863 [Benniella sp.]
MMSVQRDLRLHAPVALWLVFLLWNAYSVLAAPLPQPSITTSPSTNSSIDNSTDPFTNPLYLTPSTFTWEQAIYGILFLVIGGIELFHGYKYIRLTMLVAGFLVWASTAVMIMITLNSVDGVYQSAGIYFAVWLSVGILGAIVSFFLWHVGIVLTGTYGMFVVVAVILTAVNLTNYTVRYIIISICISTGGYLTKRYERIAIIVATSVGGAYSMMYGLDMFVQTGFRSTFRVMFSQSTKEFHSNPGTWVMIACVPAIAAIGIAWELKHHETPVGNWLFGYGAKPLPPLPGEKPPRRCCGLLVARSRKAVKADAQRASREASESGLGATDRLGSDMTLVPPPPSTKTGSREACCLPWCGKRSKDKASGKSTAVESTPPPATPPLVIPPATPPVEDTESAPTNVVTSPTPTSKEEDSTEDKPASPSTTAETPSTSSAAEKIPFELEPEAVRQAGVRKVVIQREEREFGLEVLEKV